MPKPINVGQIFPPTFNSGGGTGYQFPSHFLGVNTILSLFWDKLFQKIEQFISSVKYICNSFIDIHSPN